MIKPFDFYFDFVSPYSFLAHKEIRKIERKTSIKVRYKPILLGFGPWAQGPGPIGLCHARDILHAIFRVVSC